MFDELIVLLNPFLFINADSGCKQRAIYSIQLGQEKDVNTQVALMQLLDLHIRCGFRVNTSINSTRNNFPLFTKAKGKPTGDVKLSTTTGHVTILNVTYTRILQKDQHCKSTTKVSKKHFCVFNITTIICLRHFYPE